MKTLRCCIFLGLIGAPVCVGAESLKSAVQAALTSNPAVHAASDEARASAFDLLKLQSEFQPEVSLYGEAGAQRVDDPASLSAADNNDTKFARELGLNAKLVLFDGARRANLVYSNAARVDGSIFRLLDASETLALNATEVYIDTHRHLHLLEAAEKNLRRHQIIGRQVNRLVDGGRLPLSEKLQVQDRIRAAQLAVVDLKRSVADADARYRRIIGHTRKGHPSVPALKTSARNRQELIARAVENSFRVKIGRTNIDRAEYDRIAGEADRKPRISLNAGVRHGVDVDGTSGEETDTFVGLRMNWILHKGGRSARNRAGIARKHKAISERNVAIREVRELAERTWNSHLANAERLRILRTQLAVNRQLVEQYKTEFEAGTRSLLEMLEVERATYNIEFEKISAEASFAFSGYRMLAAQSRLAQHFGVQPAQAVLIPDFQARAKVKPTSVFKTQIPSLVRTDEN